MYAEQIYLLYEAGAQTLLAIWRLADGQEAFTCTLQGVTDFDLLECGHPLPLSRQQSTAGGTTTLAAFDLETGTKASWASWKTVFSGNLVYAPQQQTTYLFRQGEIYAVKPHGKPVLFDRVLSDDIISIALTDHGAPW